MIAADPLLLTILDRPDDDAPRLVFADWLEEQGEPQAELIRLQCELARLDKNDSRRAGLERREAELHQMFDSAWLAVIQQLGIVGRFQRGFLEVRISGIRRLLDMADRLFAIPWVLHVNLADRLPDRDMLAALVDSPYFIRLRRLDLSKSRLTNEGIQLLARSRTPCRLTHLNLSGNDISTKGLIAFLETMDLSHLTELHLSGNGIGAAGARALANSPKLAWLRVLDLTYNQLSTVGGEYLAEAKHLNQLQKLLVRGNSIGPRGKRALRRRFGPRVQPGSPY